MKPAEFQRAIESGRIPSLIYLYGDETFLVERAYHALVAKAVPPQERDFNLQVFSGRDVRAAEILDACRTLPVFNPVRLVVIQDAHQLNAGDLAPFIPYLSDPLPETILLFCGKAIDGRLAFFKEFKKKGTLVEFRRMYDNQIPAFVKEQARIGGKNFTEDGLALFCRRIGNNLGEIQAELNKLCTYLGTKPLIDIEDVKQVVSDTREESVFDLINAIGQRNPGDALRLLGRMLEDGEPPLRILTMIVRHFRQLWQAAELARQGADKGEMAKRMRINPYFVDGLVSQSRRFRGEEYRRAFTCFLETDLALKSSGGHPHALLEKLVLGLLRGGG